MAKLKKLLKEIIEERKIKKEMDFLVKQGQERLEKVKQIMRERGYDV